jgi:hypothetical protein
MDAEVGMYLRAIESSLARVVGCLAGLEQEAVHWAPMATANSLAVITKHALANAERNVFGSFLGQPYDWRRDEEFLADGESGESLTAKWGQLQWRMREALDDAPASRLAETVEHARMGSVSGRAVLLQAARHAAEHVGEAELTRALVERGQS